MRAWCRHALAVLRAHPRHLVLAGLVAGLLCGPVAPTLALATAAVLAALAGRPPVALLVAGAVLAGAYGAGARIAALDRTALRPLLGEEVGLRAELLEQPRPGKLARSAQARIVAGPGTGERVVLRIGRWGHARPASTGAIVIARGRLRALGPFDAYQRRRGAHAVLQVRTLSPTGAARGGPWGALDAVRARAEHTLETGLPPPESALLRGMVLGQDERLDPAARQDFRTSGLAHLLAASGQNVVLLAALAVPLLSLLGLGLRARLVALLGLIALYVPLAGAGPPIQRAGIMGAAGVVAALAGRPASRVYALGLAAVATLALNPRAAGDVGWQLSFAAVVAILVLAPRVRARLEARRCPALLAEGIGIAVAATLGTAPLLAFHFGRASLVSLPANLLAAPAVGPIMWLGMLAAAVGQLAAAPVALLTGLAGYPLAFLLWVAHVAARVPHASVGLRIGSVAALAGLYAVVAAFVVVRRVRRVVLVAAVTGGGVAAAGAGAAAPRPPPGPVASFLDVGQGDATLLQAGGHAVLVDAGPPGGPIVRRLAEARAGPLDVLVVTHAQADHEGGAVAVLRGHRVGLLLDGAAGARGPAHAAILAAAAHRGVRVVTPDAGQDIRAGPIALRVFWPHREPAALHAGQDPNLRAVVAEASLGGMRIGLTADAESEVTEPLGLPPVDVLKLAHHGSADPGLPMLLAEVRPRIAVVEVGRQNPYGHPTPQALGALRASGTLVYRTDRDGTVRIARVRGALEAVTEGVARPVSDR